MSGNVILTGGHALTGHPVPSNATAVAIINGRIVAVGDDQTAMRWSTPESTVIDLRGRSIAPGFNDAHCHVMMVGLESRMIDAHSPPNRSIQEILDRVAERVRVVEKGEWIFGRGYDDARLVDRRHPTRDDLDRVAPNNPVVLWRACMHVAAVNSKALEIIGVNESTPDPEGGTIDRDGSGRPTGVLREEARTPLFDVVEPTIDDLREIIVAGGETYLAQGVTSAAEAGIRTAGEMTAYSTLHQEGKLPLRTYLMMMIDETLEPLTKLGIRTGFGDERLRIGPAKIFLDGSIGGRTARMSQPYEGQDDNLGLWMEDPNVMKRKIKAAHRAGFQCCAHAIGDAAIDLLLASYEEALAELPRADHRHRVEHSSIMRRDLLDRMQRISAIPVPGTSFLYYFHKAYSTNLGDDRLRYTIAMREFRNRGIIAAASTDAPVVSTNPMIGLQSMMTRLTEEGAVVNPEESLTLEEAINSYTWAGAYASFEESIKGTLEPGKIGDVVVFESDLREIRPEKLSNTSVDITIKDGEIVYTR